MSLGSGSRNPEPLVNTKPNFRNMKYPVVSAALLLLLLCAASAFQNVVEGKPHYTHHSLSFPSQIAAFYLSQHFSSPRVAIAEAVVSPQPPVTAEVVSIHPPATPDPGIQPFDLPFFLLLMLNYTDLDNLHPYYPDAIYPNPPYFFPSK